MPRGEPTRSLPVRFTEAERAEVERAAADRGVPLTAFVRAVALQMARSVGAVEWRPPPAPQTRSVGRVVSSADAKAGVRPIGRGGKR